jgi:preprotein translocase subunit SecD
VRKNLTKIIIIVAAVLLSIYFLYPTYKDSKFTRDLRGLHGDDSLKYVDQHENAIHDAKMKRLKLGLDLQGGMRVVLEVDVLKMLEATAKDRDDNFNAVLAEVRREATTSETPLLDIFKSKFQEKGIRLSRYYGNIRDSDDDIMSTLEKLSTEAIDRGMEIIRNRVDQYGVSEPTIQKLGGRRIIVELPGVTKESEVRQLLQGTALLEFKLLKDPEVAYKIMDAIDRHLAGKAISDTSFGDTSEAKAAAARTDTATIGEAEGLNAELPQTEAEQAKEHPFLFLARPDQQGSGEAFVAEEDRAKVTRLLDRDDVKPLIPPDIEFLWSAKHLFISGGKRYYTLYWVKKEPELTGGVIVNARATIDPNFNQPIVTMEMNSEGSRDWARITGANINKRIAIVLDRAVFSAPVVRSKIIGGNSQIEGIENIDEARLLEIVLKAGALPAPVEIIEQRNVGPSLGEDSIRKGLFSTILSFSVIVLFMIAYYRTGGAVADMALLFNILFILGVLAGFQATLTLPGIAGIILTIGMAVDANVLIYERIREEAVTGKTLRAAIDAGYSKAFHAIFDSNITTFFSGVILYQFGTGPVQGFALTLMIGIAASLFSAIVITRVVFEVMVERGATAINFG